MQSPPRRVRGFTLLEVLVALVILTLFTLVSYRSLDSVLTTERFALDEMAHWRQMVLAFGRIKSDLANSLSSLEESHGLKRGFYAGKDARGSLYFSFDRLLPADQPGGVERVGYRFQNGTLERLVWREGAPVTEPPSNAPLLTGLHEVRFRYLNREGNWVPEWVPNANPIQKELLPGAVELQLQFNAEEPLRRVFLLQ